MITKKLALYGGVTAAVLAFAAVGLVGCGPEPAVNAPAVEAGVGKSPGAVVLPMTPQQVAAAEIRVEAVGSGGIDMEIIAPGTVAGAPDGEAILTAGAPGTITRIFHRLGDPVRAGEVIALVVSREGAGLAADRSVADAKVNLARQQVEREKSLFDQGISPRQDLEVAQANLAAAEAEARRANVAAGAAHVASDGRTVSVISPLSGRLTGASTQLGSYVDPETELFRVADSRRIQVEASVSATDLGRIAAGGRAAITSGDGRQFEGLIRSITPTVNEETRQATAVLSITDGETLAAGQLVNVRLFAKGGGSATPGLSVPQNAVQNVGGQDVVFVQTPEGFKVQPVQVVMRSAGRVQVTGGLEAGQLIATDNAFLLKSELGKAETE